MIPAVADQQRGSLLSLLSTIPVHSRLIRLGERISRFFYALEFIFFEKVLNRDVMDIKNFYEAFNCKICFSFFHSPVMHP